ncbi:hypothetical protein THASP1DRAFT_23305 [Thamnocephalis sphaerospora]|uniref:Uncharacterized protein n=1 Tax=Thamnocephalis sphaerospora TaxID=78915 RepID=A0A4P9XRP2_9FUNG|nr:hypothetical protein THASP1DRAFT_23305 [Thamnocephalis sphaerospora]|eukprot:RKP08755.1 hypothetical protein THASP1DRAFT_23305 [Thamnocephalis sphaerospora]
MQHDPITMTDVHDAPYPFHPRRPPTPTIRYMAFDGDRNGRPQHHAGRMNIITGSMKKAIGQLLSREWMIEEGEEKVDAGRAEVEAANKEYEQRQRKYKQRRAMQSDSRDRSGSFNVSGSGRHTIEGIDTGRRRYRISPTARTTPATLATVDLREARAR